MSDEEAIRRLLAERDEAIRRGDAEAAVSAFADGAISYDLPPPLATSFEHEGMAAGLREWFGTWEHGVEIRLEDPRIIVEGDLAVAFGLAQMIGEKKGAAPTETWYRATIVLQRTEGAWRIVHEHNSVPMSMDGSGRAMTDLKPA